MPTRFHDARDWFLEKRFGLFLHWGLYSVPGYHEQDQWRRQVPRAEYAKLLDQFNPTAYDPGAWLDLAQEVGMEYAVLTTKHHDGFCLFESEHTEYHAGNSPAGRDLFREFMDAAHARNFPAEAYYSVPDWHHRHYPNEGRSHELAQPEPGDQPNHDKYIAYLKAQIRELCTNYGQLHGIWWDLNVTGDDDPSIHQMIRDLQPAAVINNRGFGPGDYSTPEREWGGDEIAKPKAFQQPVEACNSIGMESWGWRESEDLYHPRHLQSSMAKILVKGGNYLLNVGPRPDGSIDPVQADYLRRLGIWYHSLKQALVGVDYVSDRLSPPVTGGRAEYTAKGDSLYAVFTEPPVGDALVLHPLRELPKRIEVLSTQETAPPQAIVERVPSTHWKDEREVLRLRGLPMERMAQEVIAVKMSFADETALSQLLERAHAETQGMVQADGGPFGEPG